MQFDCHRGSHCIFMFKLFVRARNSSIQHGGKSVRPSHIVDKVDLINQLTSAKMYYLIIYS